MGFECAPGVRLRDRRSGFFTGIPHGLVGDGPLLAAFAFAMALLVTRQCGRSH